MSGDTEINQNFQILQVILAKLSDIEIQTAQQRNMFESHMQKIHSYLQTYELENNNCSQKILNYGQHQNEVVQSLGEFLKFIKIDGEQIVCSEAMATLQSKFTDSINRFLEISKQSMAMVYSLDNALNELDSFEKSIDEIEKINYKTKYLAFNATIEAVRCENTEKSFQAVAYEVRKLSDDTHHLALNMRRQANSIGNTLRKTQTILKSFAQIDSNEHFLVKDYIDQLVNGITLRNQQIEDNIVSGHSINQEFSQATTQLIQISKMHNKCRQEFENIMIALFNLINALSDSNHTINDLIVEHFAAADADQPKQIIQNIFTVENMHHDL